MATQSPMKPKLGTIIPHDKLPEDHRITVKLRVHARTEDLDVKWAKDILGISESDPMVKRVFAYGDEGILGIDFRNGEELVSLDEAERWHRSVFRVATQWLKNKSKDQFREVKDTGSRADLLVSGYEGYIPKDLLKEIVRLEIDLLVIGNTSK